MNLELDEGLLRLLDDLRSKLRERGVGSYGLFLFEDGAGGETECIVGGTTDDPAKKRAQFEKAVSALVPAARVWTTIFGKAKCDCPECAASRDAAAADGARTLN